MRLALAIGLLFLLSGATFAHVAAASDPVPTDSADYIIRIIFYLVNLNFDDRVLNFTVPIPPNTTWQTSHLDSYSFQPIRLPYNDEANNTLMDYSILVPSLNITTFEYDVSVQVNSTPGFPVSPSQAASKLDIPSNLQDFTVPTYWWNYTNPIFASAKLDLLSYYGNDNLTQTAMAVRNETLHLISNFRAASFRLGATEALQLSLGDASEYSDVFVALMRSLSLPATRLWSWIVENVQAGVVTWAGFVQSAFWSPGWGWLPYDVTTSQYVNSPAIGEVSDRIITFYIENNLPGPGVPIPLMLSQDNTFFPGGGTAVKSGILTTTRISINYVPRTENAAVQLFTLTTTVGVTGAAIVLIVLIVSIGYFRARARRRAYQDRLDEFEKRLRSVSHG